MRLEFLVSAQNFHFAASPVLTRMVVPKLKVYLDTVDEGEIHVMLKFDLYSTESFTEFQLSSMEKISASYI